MRPDDSADAIGRVDVPISGEQMLFLFHSVLGAHNFCAPVDANFFGGEKS
jgi:hypothetical protein